MLSSLKNKIKEASLVKSARYIVLVAVIFFSLMSGATSTPKTFTYQGRFMNAAGTAPLTGALTLVVELYEDEATPDCLMFSERHSITTADGLFSISVGSGTRNAAYLTFNDDPSWDMKYIFDNSHSFTNANCPAQTLAANAQRKLRLHVYDGSTWTQLADQTVTAVPQAIVAETLQGREAIEFTQSWTTATRPAAPVPGQMGFNTTTDRIESWTGAAWEQKTPAFSTTTKDGTATDNDVMRWNDTNNEWEPMSVGTLLGSAAGDLTGTWPNIDVVGLDGNPVSLGALAGGDTGKVLKWNGTQWIADTDNGGTIVTGGTANRVTKFNATGDNVEDSTITDDGVEVDFTIPLNMNTELITGVGTSSGVSTDAVNVAYLEGYVNPGVPATPFLKWNDTNQAWEASTLVAADISDLDLTDYVLRDGTTALTGNWNVGGFDITNIGYITQANNKYLGLSRLTAGEEITLEASFDAAPDPTVYKGMMWFNSSTNKIMYYDGADAQPVAMGGAGSVASVNSASGAVTLGTSVTSGTDTGPDWNGSTTLNIPLASNAATTVGGLLTNAEYTTLNNKQDAIADGTIAGQYLVWDDTNNVWEPASVTVASDITSAYDEAGNLTITVTKIQANPVDNTVLANVAGDIGKFFRWDGTEWVSVKLSVTDLSGVITEVEEGTADDEMLVWNDTAQAWEPMTVSGDVSIAHTYDSGAPAGTSVTTVTGIRGQSLDTTLATLNNTTDVGKILKWDGAKWIADVDAGAAGTIAILEGANSNTVDLAIDTTGTAPTNWSLTDAVTDVVTLNIPEAKNAAAGGTLGLISKTDYDTLAAKQDAITDGTDTDHYLKWDGDSWEPAFVSKLYESDGGAAAVTVDATGNTTFAGNASVTGDVAVTGNTALTGTLQFDAGQAIDTISTETDLDDGAGASNSVLSTQLAVKTYVDTAVGAIPDFSDGTVDGQILVWDQNDLAWEPVTTAQDLSMTDTGVATVTGIRGKLVTTTAPASMGQIYYYDSAANAGSGEWKLADMTGLADGYVLKWDDTGKVWKVGADAGAAGTVASLQGLTGTLDFAIRTDQTSAAAWDAADADTVRLSIPEAKNAAAGGTLGLISKTDYDALAAKQDAITDGTDTDHYLKWDGDSWEPAFVSKLYESDGGAAAVTVNATGAATFASTMQFGAGQAVGTFSTETDLDEGAGAVNTAVPTQLAVKTYVDAAVGSALDASELDGQDGITITDNAGTLEFDADVDNSTVELSAADGTGQIRVKDLGITVGKLADDAVETAKIKDGNVTLSKLADGTSNGQVMFWDATNSAWTYATMTGLADGKILKWDAACNAGAGCWEVGDDAGAAGTVASIEGVAGTVDLQTTVTSGTDAGPTWSVPAGSDININIPLASNAATTTGGLLTNAEYVALNNKQDALTDGTDTDHYLKWDGDSWEPAFVSKLYESDGGAAAVTIDATGNATLTGTLQFDAGQAVGAVSTETDLDDGAGASNSVLSTQLAVKTYVDTITGAIDGLPAGSADGSVLYWDQSAGSWVQTVAPSDNYILKWDDATDTWVPEADAGGTTIAGGTQNVLPKFNATGDNIVDSSVTDDGTNVLFSLSPVVTTNSLYMVPDASAPTAYGRFVYSFAGGPGADTNAFLGFDAGNEAAFNGINNTGLGTGALGSMAGTFLNKSSNNTAVGYNSLSSLTLGDANIALGASSASLITTGSNNIVIGTGAGGMADTTSAGNIFLGNQAGPTVQAVVSNRLYIDNSQTDTPLIYGDFSSDFVKINGNFEANAASFSGDVNILSGGTFSYYPRGTECADGEILEWDDAGDYWKCGTDDLGAAGGISSLEGMDGGSVDLAIGTTGNSPSWAAVDGGGTDTVTLNIPLASAAGTVTAGLISNAQYARIPASGTTNHATLRWDGTGWVETTGLTIDATGNVVLAADPDAAMEAATKQYVDAAAGALPDGSGTQYTVPRWTDTDTLGDSPITTNAAGTVATVNADLYMGAGKRIYADVNGVAFQDGGSNNDAIWLDGGDSITLSSDGSDVMTVNQGGLSLYMGNLELLDGNYFTKFHRMTTANRNTMTTGWGLLHDGRMWYNSTTDKLEYWDGSLESIASESWVTSQISTAGGSYVLKAGDTMTGDLTMSGAGVEIKATDGTYTAPSYTFASDTDSGMFLYAPNTIAFGSGGTLPFQISNTQSAFFTDVHLDGTIMTLAGGIIDLQGGNIQGVGLGNATTPFISFESDANTGMFSPAADKIAFATNGVERFRITNAGVSLTAADPTARLHLPAGTTTANTAPLKLTSGALNTTAEAGAIEFLTNDLYYTGTDNARRKIATTTGSGGVVDGTGTTNYLTKWSDSDTIANSALTDNATTLAYTGTGGLNLSTTSPRIYFNGTLFGHNYGTNNTFFGAGAGNTTLTTGSAVANTAVGATALDALTTGTINVAVGSNALGNVSSGGYNIGIGNGSGLGVTTSSSNIAIGALSLGVATSGENVAVGESALSNSSGVGNTAVGYNSTSSSISTPYNTALGHSSSARGGRSVAIGNLALASGVANSIAIGYSAIANGTSGAIALGSSSSAAGTGAVAIGESASAGAGNSVAIKGTTTGSGYIAINGTASGGGGIAIGGSASALYTTAIGYSSAASGIGSVGVGSNTNNGGATGSYNTVVGSDAGYLEGTSAYNTMLGGLQYLYNPGTTATQNTFVGYNIYEAGSIGGTSTLSNNVAVGGLNFDSAYASNVTTADNTAVGVGAGSNFVGKSGNTAVGRTAGGTGNYQVAVGYQAGGGSADNVVGIGRAALTGNTGAENVAVGAYALDASPSGGGNTALGTNALSALTTGTNNTALGRGAMSGATSSADSVAVGYSAGNGSASFTNSIAIGSAAAAGGSSVTYSYDIYMGRYTGLFANSVTSSFNVIIGNATANLTNAATLTGNTFLGSYSGWKDLDGSTDSITYNTAIGYQAQITGDTVTSATAIGRSTSVSASNSTALGALTSVSGAKSVAIGYNISTSTANRLVIDTDAAANNLIEGDFANNRLGIGRAPTTYALEVAGGAGKTDGTTTWVNISDRRLKENIRPYEYGLNEILKLKTARYNYIKNNPIGMDSEGDKIGFVAQEVMSIIPDAVSLREDGYYQLNVDPIHWAAINAIQELNNKCEMSQEQITSIESRMENVERKIASLEQANQKLEAENKQLKSDIEKIKKALNIK